MQLPASFILSMLLHYTVKEDLDQASVKFNPGRGEQFSALIITLLKELEQ